MQTITCWQHCYDDSWKGLIVDESFSHPAKYAPGLIERIAAHLALPRGAVVVDPFGGVGLGGVVFAGRGVQWVGCELEEKFVKLALQNFKLHRKTWQGFGDPLPIIIQGDSRRLRLSRLTQVDAVRCSGCLGEGRPDRPRFRRQES